MVMIANVTYKGSLKAKLIAPKVPIPFDNLDELADYYDITPLFGLGSYLVSGVSGLKFISFYHQIEHLFLKSYSSFWNHILVSEIIF